MDQIVTFGAPITGYNISLKQDKKDDTKILPGLYSPDYGEDGDLFLLKSAKGIRLPKNITNLPKLNAKIVYQSYLNRPGRSTGVIFSGIHGDGKTLTSEILCVKFMDNGKSVIVVNKYVSNIDLLKISAAVGPCLFLFDEFDRYYDRNQQDEMVGFFSDSGLVDTMLIMTTNNYNDIKTVLKNRPSRFLLHIKHEGVGMSMFNDMTKGVVFDKEFLDELTYYITTIKPSYDVVKVITQIAEMADNSIEDFIKIIDIYNIPDWPGLNCDCKTEGVTAMASDRQEGELCLVLDRSYRTYRREYFKVKVPRKPDTITIPNPFLKIMQEKTRPDFSLSEEARPKDLAEKRKLIPEELTITFSSPDGYNHMTEDETEKNWKLPHNYIKQK